MGESWDRRHFLASALGALGLGAIAAACSSSSSSSTPSSTTPATTSPPGTTGATTSAGTTAAPTTSSSTVATTPPTVAPTTIPPVTAVIGKDGLPIGRPDLPVKLPIYDDNKAVADGLAPEKGTLDVFNFADYVNPDTLKKFEQRYKVKVRVTTFETDAELVQKLQSGAFKGDLVLSSAYNTLPTLVARKLIQPLNRTYLKNFGNVLPAFQDPFYDLGSQYTVPYTVFGTGIGYRTDKLTAAEMDTLGWNALWDTKFKGEILVLDDYREALGMAMLRNGGTDVNTTDVAVVKAAGKSLQELTSQVNVKVSIDGYKDIPDGSASIAHMWTGDIINAMSQLPKGVKDDVLGFWYPKDRKGIVNNDCMVVLAKAKHPVLAHLLIDFLCDPANASDNYSFVGYQPALSALTADALVAAGAVPDHLRNSLMTDEDIRNGHRLLSLVPDLDKVYEDTFATFKAGG